ncbi:hypothetical protein EW145_g5243 [Phellinidium pouzarii]|uniref:RRM domain-containing protein n=1 Tax=Phellinidium pouzarii TaxID=167371 RepID=A0A4S4L0U5_9AGAM|nr:hypothetical protein EW145_g5243 [Phellinidium pouzarii]
MPRRPPPTSLRLVQGTLPPRGYVRHTLPSVPRPVLVPRDVSRTSSWCATETHTKQRLPLSASADPTYSSAHRYTSSADSNSYAVHSLRRSSGHGLNNSTFGGMGEGSTPSTATSVEMGTGRSSPSPSTTPSTGASMSPPSMRGPWDHTYTASLSIDVDSVLALPKPVAPVMTSTSSTPPDISSLSISSQQTRPHDPYDYDSLAVGSNPRQQFHFSTSPVMSGQLPYNPLGLNQSPLKNKSLSRSGLPTQWLDNQVMNDSRSMSPPSNSDISSGGSPPMSHLQVPIVSPPLAQNGEEEVIPTAIVIKNIPFNVKRETLLDIITSLAIPTPYAFNYHLDTQGAFRGLAFANFRQASDADAVVAALNGFDVQGRKLRVEYKKVLQAGEKERIEREKALRRMRSMQLEKEQQAMHQPQQHDEFGPIGPPMFSTPRSVSTPYNAFQQQQNSPPNVPAMPMPMPQQYGVPSPVAPIPPTTPSNKGSSTELDLNDASTLEIYSRILLFKDDHMRDELAFSRTLSPKQRRVVHLVAQKLGVYHYSVGEGEERYAVVTRIDPERVSHPMQAEPRRTLSRAPSAYMTPSVPQVSASSLRTKKSMPDMKTLHTQAPRLTSRASNGNIREGYATIASPSRRLPGGFGALFGSNGAFGSAGVPPVPSLPSSLSAPLNGSAIREGELASSNVMRQPRGPTGGGGFGSRRERVSASEGAGRGLEARSHEPLEI